MASSRPLLGDSRERNATRDVCVAVIQLFLLDGKLRPHAALHGMM
jgi:hypothetical protein